MSNPDRFTESENEVLRLVLAFVKLPGSRLKLTESEQQAVQSAQHKLNSQSW